jgi:tetratricopeptide (TPR) repeat protein
MRITSMVLFLGLFVICTALPPAHAEGGTQRSTTPDVEPERSVEELATEAYNRGIEQRDRAWKLEEKLAAGNQSEKASAKLEKKIRRSYDDAAREFLDAVRHNPGLFQAFSSLGYAERKLGNYESALEAYNRALAIEPKYSEAIEYRAEAFLALGRIDDAKQAYDQLVELNREHAAKLLEAMKTWVDRKRADPGDLGPQSVKELENWIRQKDEMAGDVAGHASPEKESGW